MKNKKLIYVLLPLVIIIWGLVFYRIFFEGRTSPENINSIVKPRINEEVKKENSSYKLIANYRDPFLSNIKNHAIQMNDNEDNEEKNNARTTNLRRRRTSISRVRWPEILYGGFIEGNKNDNYTILLNINNRDYLAYEGDTIDQIFVKRFYGDSIIVVYNEEEKTLVK